MWRFLRQLVCGKRRKPKAITQKQFIQLFQALDDKLYSGQLRRDGVGAFLADDISPAHPFIYRLGTTPERQLSGETCTEPHGYSRTVKEIVVSQNQPNDAIVQGLLIEMQRAAVHLKEFYQFLDPILGRGAEILDEVAKLTKGPPSEWRLDALAKLLEGFPKLE